MTDLKSLGQVRELALVLHDRQLSLKILYIAIVCIAAMSTLRRCSESVQFVKLYMYRPYSRGSLIVTETDWDIFMLK